MANVSETHPAFSAMEAVWTLCRTVAAGARAVKTTGRLYLPQPSGMDGPNYATYLRRAPVFAAMGKTIQALCGTVFTRPPIVQGAPAVILPQLADLTFRDESVENVAVQIVTELLTVGRCGIWLDLAEARQRPYWCVYPAEQIVNWRTARVGNDPDVLVQVIIRGDAVEPTPDGFGRTTVTSYYELALNDGIYQVRKWSASDPAIVRSTTVTPWSPGDWITPTRRGTALDFIPFTFVGPTGITADVGKPPLEDLGELVLSHYLLGADLRWSLYLVACPTPWVSGAKGTGPLKIGSSVAWDLEKDGRAGMLEFSGKGVEAIAAAMAALEKQMAVLGGRLLLEVPHGQVQETATSARLRYASETASLRTIAGAVSAALTRVLRWHIWWMTSGDIPLDVRVDLTDEFFQLKASPEDVKALLVLFQADSISFETFFDGLQKGGWTREGVTAEQELEAIARGGSHTAA
jgi:hypothetical protein